MWGSGGSFLGLLQSHVSLDEGPNQSGPQFLPVISEGLMVSSRRHFPLLASLFLFQVSPLPPPRMRCDR